MSQEDILRRVFALLDELRVEYMLTGSFASNVYGRVRSTFDADIVVAIQGSRMKRFSQALGEEFYVDAETIDEAREQGGQFNAIHRPSGLKIDFYLPRNAHDREALRRRKTFDLFGRGVFVISPEDLILAKLSWAKQGGSARQLEDAQGIYEVQRREIDQDYLRSKAAELALNDELALILK